MATVTFPSTSNLALNTNAPEYFRCDTHCEGVLKRLRCRQDLYDVVLVVGDSGKRISAHRLILIASSDYFSALLSGPMCESQEREITLRDVDGDALEQLVNFCYTGSLELRVDTIKPLITTAKYLQFKEIIEGCCEFFQRNLQPSNCLFVASFAEQMNLETLLHNAKEFTCEHFEKVSNHSEFFLLTAKQLTEYIASNKLNVPSEEFVFGAVMNWIGYEPENRRKHFTDLLALVRLPLLSSTFLAEEVEPLCNTVESHKLFVGALNSHLLHTCNSTEIRNYRSKSPAKHLLGIYAEKFKFQLASYNLHTKAWSVWNSRMNSLDHFAVALMDDNVIIVGGSYYSLSMTTVTSVNLRTMTSTEMPPLQTGRCRHRVAILKGSVYAIGGYDGHRVLNSVERWDPASRTWSSVAPMENDRIMPGVAVMDGHLYVSGGRCGTDYLTSVECYDPVENTWRYTASMKVGRESHCLGAHKGYLFVIGGCNDDKRNKDIPVERYEPRTETWTTIPCSPAIYGSTRCVSGGPDLFIINNFNIYKISYESSCDNLKLQQILDDNIDILRYMSPLELVGIPYEFRPPPGNWIKEN